MNILINNVTFIIFTDIQVLSVVLVYQVYIATQFLQHVSDRSSILPITVLPESTYRLQGTHQPTATSQAFSPEALEALVSNQLREHLLEISLQGLEGRRVEVDFHVSSHACGFFPATTAVAIESTLLHAWQEALPPVVEADTSLARQARTAKIDDKMTRRRWFGAKWRLQNRHFLRYLYENQVYDLRTTSTFPTTCNAQDLFGCYWQYRAVAPHFALR